jgi:hypothetical protein
MLQDRVGPSPTPAANISLKIHETDVYAQSATALTQLFKPEGQRAWYFFSPSMPKSQHGGKRRKRSMDSGRWHDEGKKKPVVTSETQTIGYRNLFSFKTKIDGRKEKKTVWIMHEFRLNDVNEGNLVLCKVYASSRRWRRHKQAQAEVEEEPTQAQVEVQAAEAARAQPQTKVQERATLAEELAKARENDEAALAAREKAVGVREEAVEVREAEVARREKAMGVREAAVARREREAAVGREKAAVGVREEAVEVVQAQAQAEEEQSVGLGEVQAKEEAMVEKEATMVVGESAMAVRESVMESRENDINVEPDLDLDLELGPETGGEGVNVGVKGLWSDLSLSLKTGYGPRSDLGPFLEVVQAQAEEAQSTGLGEVQAKEAAMVEKEATMVAGESTMAVRENEINAEPGLDLARGSDQELDHFISHSPPGPFFSNLSYSL